MAIPVTSPDQIIAAMHKFDQELRNTTRWEGWERKLNFKYAIRFEDRSGDFGVSFVSLLRPFTAKHIKERPFTIR